MKTSKDLNLAATRALQESSTLQAAKGIPGFDNSLITNVTKSNLAFDDPFISRIRKANEAFDRSSIGSFIKASQLDRSGISAFLKANEDFNRSSISAFIKSNEAFDRSSIGAFIKSSQLDRSGISAFLKANEDFNRSSIGSFIKSSKALERSSIGAFIKASQKLDRLGISSFIKANEDLHRSSIGAFIKSNQTLGLSAGSNFLKAMQGIQGAAALQAIRGLQGSDLLKTIQNTDNSSASKVISELVNRMSSPNVGSFSLGQAYQEIQDKYKATENTSFVEAFETIADGIEKQATHFPKGVLSTEFFIGLLITLILYWLGNQGAAESEKRILDRFAVMESFVMQQLVDLKKEEERETFYIVLRPAYLLMNPGKMTGEKIANLYPNQKVRLVEEKSKWIKVEYFDNLEGIHKSGWVYKKYLKILNQKIPESRKIY